MSPPSHRHHRHRNESGRRPKLDPAGRGSGGADVAGAAGDTRSFNALVGEGIRRARQQLGWTQAVLAEEAGLSSNYVARLERGELGPSLFVAKRLCEALGVAVESLFAPEKASSSRRTARRRLGA